jgi:hypothetical protein
VTLVNTSLPNVFGFDTNDDNNGYEGRQTNTFANRVFGFWGPWIESTPSSGSWFIDAPVPSNDGIHSSYIDGIQFN